MTGSRSSVEILKLVLRDLRDGWRPLMQADLLFKVIAFATISPLIGLLLKALVSRTGGAAVADVDIALFFFTTRSGAIALILVSALTLAVVSLGNACMMTIALARDRGTPVRVRDAFAHGARNAFAIVRVAILLVVRLLGIAAPFVVAVGATYWALLREHDINFYLAQRPSEFLLAVAIAAAILLLLAALLTRLIASWALTMPLVVFERVLPVKAFGESARRMAGHKARAISVLAVWAAFAIVLPMSLTAALQASGRAAAPVFGGSMAGLIGFIGAFTMVWGGLTLGLNVLSNVLFVLIVLRLYLEAGPSKEPSLPVRSGDVMNLGGGVRVSYRVLAGALVIGVLLASELAYFLMRDVWTERAVLVIAHRGASGEAPENTLAAFRLAGLQGADYVELDVQETQDGVVIVAHDKDLMKVAGSPLRIFESTAEQLGAIDIGSYRSADFKDERVPTLAAALAACKGVSRVDIELKDYGHDDHLPERVVELVEAAGMQDQIVTMSLSREQVTKMKRLRPQWTSGLLTAKAIGNLSGLPVDFLAVESGMATRRFIRSAHAAKKAVYVWTVNDPQRMIRMIGFGVDGLITDRPALAKEVLARYAKMSQAERLFLFVMTRLGAKPEISENPDELRP